MSVRSFALSAAGPHRASRARAEHHRTFACFGGRCTVIVADAGRPADAAAAAMMAERRLTRWHGRFSRFDPASELSAVNRDPRSRVPVTPLMRRVIEAALAAAHDTGGLVDATLGDEIERAGYAHHFEGVGVPLALALSQAPRRAPAGASPARRWARIEVDRSDGTITRPVGLRIDPGGIAKGVFADELAALLAGFDAYAVDCGGDLRLGGTADVVREVNIASPFDDRTLHTFALRSGAVATSGIGKRSWRGPDGRPAHHLLDPRTGAPAYTGVVQATALAPTTAEAETLAKAAVLSGSEGAAQWCRYGGVVVGEDGGYTVLEPPGSASAHGTTIASSWGESRATTYSAGSRSEMFSSTCVSRGGT